MIFIFSMVKFKERQAKRDTLYRLRGMSDRMLLDCDISPELLKKGIKAWPWRNTHDNTIQTQNAYKTQQRNECSRSTHHSVPFRRQRKIRTKRDRETNATAAALGTIRHHLRTK